MKIAILGWGSLIWDLGSLPLENEWQIGGPRLPVEFSRVTDSRKGALTLVIDPDNGESVSTRFAISKSTELVDAINDLRIRERTNTNRIGYVNIVNNSERCNTLPGLSMTIREWALSKNFDAVVWTDLPSNYEEKTQARFSIEEAVNYLHELPNSGAIEARKYIINSPQEIDTPLRRKLKDDPWLNG